MDMNKPVAWMGLTAHNQNRVSIEKLANDDIPLYTHPVKELNNGGELVKNATYWKRQYNLMATQNDNLKSGLYHANEQIKYLESHPAELTDEEIKNFIATFPIIFTPDDLVTFAKAILRKAQEK